jgi:hypothetical protein
LVARVSITISSSEVGTISADPEHVISTGGPTSPTLVVPVEVALEPHGDGEPTLGLHWLDARLSLPGTTAGAWPPVGPSCFRFTGALGHATIHSLPTPAQRHLPLDFALTNRQVRAVEALAHENSTGVVSITLSFSGLVCEVAGGGPLSLRRGRGAISSNYLAGNVYDLRPIAETRIGELVIPVSRERWATQILPGLGLDRLRLVATRLPGREGLGAPMVERFDQAIGAYDAGRYEQSITLLRKLREAVERAHGATRSRRIAIVIAERRGWSQEQVASFDSAWRALVDITNEAVHADDRPPRPYHHAEARLALILAAAALEYLSEADDAR